MVDAGRKRRGHGHRLLRGSMLLPSSSCLPAGWNRHFTGPQPIPAEAPAHYDYPKRPTRPTITLKVNKKHYDILEIEFPSALNVFGEENTKIDHYAGTANRARHTLLFRAGFDQVVPTWTGKQLREAIGGPRTFYLPAGHYTSFLYLPFAQWESLSFTRSQLDRNPCESDSATADRE